MFFPVREKALSCGGKRTGKEQGNPPVCGNRKNRRNPGIFRNFRNRSRRIVQKIWRRAPHNTGRAV